MCTSTCPPAFSIYYNYYFVHRTATIVDLPVPAGRLAVPLTICSPFFGFTANRMHTSTLSLKVANEWYLTSYRAWNGLYSICFSSDENNFYLFACLFWNLLGTAPFLYLLKKLVLCNSICFDQLSPNIPLIELKIIN
jgi:hypothetical protein